MGPIFKFIGVALIAAAGLFATVGASSAMPVAPTQQRTESGLLQDVRWGCDPGWAPNRWGRCVPIRRYYARAITMADRAIIMAGHAITATIALGAITIVPTGMDRAGIIGNEILPGASSLDEDGPWELYPKST
jgi:hypothetical protein